jgi:hypothetical protein
MQKSLQGIFSLFRKTNPPQKRLMRKPWGQSLVEVAIAFPILIMLFGGVVEFGFILNEYLSLMDATRESARYWSNDDPICHQVSTTCAVADGVTPDDNGFYYETAYDVQKLLDPSITDSAYRGRRIVLDPTKDDVIVAVYGAKGSIVDNLRPAGPYHLFPTPGHASGNYPSLFTGKDEDGNIILPEDIIKTLRISNAPNAGILVVEIHYNYHHTLNLPWMTAILPNPLHLQAYSIMPIRSGEPE